MRPNNVLVMNALATSASRNSSAIWSEFLVRASFQAVVTGSSSAGTLQMQGSNDYPGEKQGTLFTPTNWSNVGSAVTVSAPGVFLIPSTECSYEYIRVTYTDTSSGSGNGVISIRMKSIGM